MRVDFDNPITGSFWAPVGRLAQSTTFDWSARVLGAAGALAQVVWNDFFLMALVAVFASHLYDWFYGRMIARIQDGGIHFSEEVSRLGLHSKMATFVIILLVRALEVTIAGGGLAETKGMLAAGIAVVYVVQDIRSIEAKKLASTGSGRIPLLSTILDGIEHLVTRAVPTQARVIERVQPDDDKGGPE